LDVEDSNDVAARDVLPGKLDSFTTPEKRRGLSAFGDMTLADAPGTSPASGTSPEPPATPSRQRDVGCLQSVAEDNDLDTAAIDDASRLFCGTKVFNWNDPTLPAVLVSTVKKMLLAKQRPVDDQPTVLRLANETSCAWKKAPPRDNLKFNRCISKAVQNFYFWEYLGNGADGKAFLVSGGTHGAVGVLKFFYADAPERANQEASTWTAIYGHLAPVASVRVVKVAGQTALLMPWFHSPRRSKETLEAVRVTLLNDYQRRGFRHGDVAWRNVGVYVEQGQTKAIVFDMQQVTQAQTAQQADWVELAVASLAPKLEVDDL
jgi:hypothetical protein